MLKRIQALPPGARLVVFISLMIGLALAFIGIVAFLSLGAINQQNATQSAALLDGVTVREFANLPDDDSYPATVAAASDGTLYTGSYKTGVVWRIGADGVAQEIPHSRDQIGSVAGLTVAADGVVYITDLLDPNTQKANLKRLLPTGEIEVFAPAPAGDGFALLDGVLVTPDGAIYVSDRERDGVWRYAADSGEWRIFWFAPEVTDAQRYAPSGLGYDATTQTLVISDSYTDSLYRVSLDGATTTLLYRFNGVGNAPALDGLTVAPDGTVYVAALGTGQVLRLDGERLTPLAGSFRGASDVALNPINGKLYVSNFDSRALVLAGFQPRLPFTIDEITLAG